MPRLAHLLDGRKSPRASYYDWGELHHIVAAPNRLSHVDSLTALQGFLDEVERQPYKLRWQVWDHRARLEDSRLLAMWARVYQLLSISF